MALTFRQLEAFHAIMTSGSASRAAELLQVSQPAVSRALADLEQEVGFALFDRVRGRLVPTPEGQMFFTDVGANFAGLDRLRAAAARIRDFGSGTIRVASLAALGSTLVPRAIRRFRDAHPGIAITLHIASSAIVRDLVVSGQFDIGLAADEVDRFGVDHRAFGSFRAVCALPPGHELARRKVIEAKDLHGRPFVALAPEDRARARMNRAFEDAGVRPDIVVETPNSATVCALALEGVGIGLVNPMATDGFAERGLVFRPFEPAIDFKALLLFRPDTQRAILVKAFTAALLRARFRPTN
ncbi:LysR family transcriptional regulator [Rhodovastum atsumiense]|uniref:LysR substrate-binding domain-containing protein n=1 Tax=Rhodovastum atsumiense TaxID=504468 RepID=UPI00193BFEA9|nr:LysR substrate-binding domain-containing protein [Rhodovastum atsumiense]CAH2603529.1 LysR family transcriptional regulator [Rhodovastum atsumiense]